MPNGLAGTTSPRVSHKLGISHRMWQAPRQVNTRPSYTVLATGTVRGIIPP